MSAAGQWRSLSPRVIWVDLVISILALLPGVIAIVVFGVEPSAETLWPFGIIAGLGVFGAVADVIRWIFTRYRISEGEVERRTGVFVRHHRSVRRDRIRSVDTHAKLRHRLSGLRVVTIGAGQQTSSGEAAFMLDALTRSDAEDLRGLLLGERPVGVSTAGVSADEAPADSVTEELAAAHEDAEVFATLRPWWVVFNMFSVWAYLMAAGLLWGLYFLAQTFGFNLIEYSSRFVDWGELGWVGITVTDLIRGGNFGAIAMGESF
ncbi:MAG: PH domain-containing protein, partial [Ruaniaceae bacterium]|nr:PH domain-containing protein [Ruaniaceae bacterium]